MQQAQLKQMISYPRLLIALPLLLFALVPVFPFSSALQQLLVEAYVGVSVFVIMTVSAVKLFERFSGLDLGAVSQTKPHLQILIASLLGVFPGCGGTMLVIGYYLRGEIRFAAVVAALTATMGDTAFLLLAQRPTIGVSLLAMTFTTAIITGYLVQLLHGADSSLNLPLKKEAPSEEQTEELTDPSLIQQVRKFWWLLALPGIVIGLVRAAFIGSETHAFISLLIFAIGLTGACLSIFLWIFEGEHEGFHMCEASGNQLKWIEVDTTFITIWVIFSYISYELMVHYLGLDLLQVLVNSAKYFLPLVAIMIGFIPGCGPQIIVATLYLNDIIPLSSQIGNAISTDGDALFPAVALAPKAAIIATFYSALPSFPLAYGYLFLFE